MKIKEKGIWTTEATAVLNVKAGRQSLQKIAGTRSSYRGSEVLIFLHVKHVFAAGVPGSVRETPLN